MPYHLSRPYLRDDRDPLVGTGPHGYAYVDGRWFDYTSLADDAYGNRVTERGMCVAYNTVSKKLEPYDHANGNPTYEMKGICVDRFDIRNGDVAMNVVNAGKIDPDKCWCVNTGGNPTTLTGSGLVTAIQARLANNHLYGLQFE